MDMITNMITKAVMAIIQAMHVMTILALMATVSAQNSKETTAAIPLIFRDLKQDLGSSVTREIQFP